MSITRSTFIKISKIFALVAFSFTFTPALAFAASYPALNSNGGAGTSFNWSGYVATKGTFTNVSGSWTVPSVTPSASAQADATWIGIGGVSTSDLIQIGTQEITQNGAVSYEAWYELLPTVSTPISLTVHAGDSITASLQEEQTNQWQLTIRDNTSGQSYSTMVSYTSSLSSAEWIEEMPSDQSGFIPLDNFTSVSFSGLSAVDNGTTVTPAQANAFSLTMIVNSAYALAIPSALGSDGASFSVSRSPVAATVAPRTVQLDGRGGFRRGGGGVSSYQSQPHARFITTRQSFYSPRNGWVVRVSSVQFVRMFSHAGY
jgi:hypothetical protein